MNLTETETEASSTKTSTLLHVFAETPDTALTKSFSFSSSSMTFQQSESVEMVGETVHDCNYRAPLSPR